jgi:hypothetical protein
MSWLSNLFHGGRNSANAAMPYLNQIPGQTQPYQQPFFNAGTSQLPLQQNEYNSLINNPGGKLNQIGQSFHESPGFQFALQQALQGGGHAAAAGGMAGSPQHEQQNMGLATDLANQDYYNYLNGATGLYNAGLNGGQQLVQGGQQAGQNMSDTIAQQLAQQGNLAFQGQQQQNQNQSDLFGNIFHGVGALGAFKPFQNYISKLFGG